MEQERNRHNDVPNGGSDADGNPGDNLNRIRAEFDRTVNAGRSHIRRALSRDSLQFNRDVRQEGGQ